MNPNPCPRIHGEPHNTPLLYGSVCSGIEAVSLAWLGRRLVQHLHKAESTTAD